jgi:hypothetical protein
MFKEWRYRLEKGRPHLIMLVGLLLVIVGVIVLGGLIVYVSGIGETFRESLWWTFLHVSDPGYLGDDDTPVTAVFGTLFTILGMITFVAGLIGILTSLITSLLISLREGGAPIAFSDHIVIFGWNSRVFTLLADLLHADGEHRIALLGSMDKAEAEKRLEARVFDKIHRREGASVAHRARGRVVYRQGSAAVDHDLNRVSASRATRFILLADESNVSETAIDVTQIRTLYSIERAHFDQTADRKHLTTVVELATEKFRSHAFFAMKANPRLDTWVAYYEDHLRRRGLRSYLPAPGPEARSNNDMTAVNTDQITSRVLVQCAVQPFMSGVYDEIFSFQGKEMFLWQPGPEWGSLWTQMLDLPPADRPAFLNGHIEEGLVIGCFDGEHFKFEADQWCELDNSEVRYVILGDKQRWNNKPLEEKLVVEYSGRGEVSPIEVDREYRVLVLGMNRRFHLLMEQFGDYVEQYEGARITIDVLADADESLVKQPEEARIDLTYKRGNFTQWEVLGPQLEENEAYETIILLSEDMELDDPEVDAQVTLALVMLRAFREDPAWETKLSGLNLVAEIRDPRNRTILHQEQLAGDVVVGDEYVAGFIAQVCVDHRLEELYREVLDYGQHEIYARQLNIEGGEPICFGDLVRSSAQKGETAIGFLKYNDGIGMRPILAPALYTEINQGDIPLVLADE